MASKVRSFRAPSEVWEALDAAAREAGENGNALLVRLIRAHLSGEGVGVVSGAGSRVDAAKAALQRAEAKAAHLGASKEGEAHQVQIGPVRYAPGQRLKGAGKGRR